MHKAVVSGKGTFDTGHKCHLRAAGDAARRWKEQAAPVSSCSSTGRCYSVVNRSPAGVWCVSLVACHCFGLWMFHEHVCGIDVWIRVPDPPPFALNTSCHQNKEATASIYLDSLCLRQAECRPQAAGLKWQRGLICTQKAWLKDRVTARLGRDWQKLRHFAGGVLHVLMHWLLKRYMKSPNWSRDKGQLSWHVCIIFTSLIRLMRQI